VATVADDVASVIEALGWERPVVAGQSWGANVVLELGARHARLTRGLVLVDGGWLEPSRSFASWEACREVLAPPRFTGLTRADIEAYVRSAHSDWPETGIQGALANFRDLPDGSVTPCLTFERHMLVLHGLWDHRPSQRYRDVPDPVLLVPAYGDAARDADKRVALDEALAALPSARCHPFTADHDIHAQHPDELAGVMVDCLADGFFA
jgi:pimeloyl-ACP methyl ester carboxylesterase